MPPVLESWGRLAEAERIVNEAAREKELLQEEAMLRGGGKAAAESASEERNVGQGNATDAGGVEAKIETVKPAEEGRFDWKQGAEAAENPIEKYAQLRYHEDGTIVVTDDWRGQAVRRVPGKYRENAVVDILSQDKVEHDRTLFDKEGRIKTQIHGGDHGNPKKHPFGENGEHAHDYDWAAKNPHGAARELTEQERIQHADILQERKKRKEKHL